MSNSQLSTEPGQLQREAPVNWCPKDQTVLANEQVEDGRCWRCGSLVERRNLSQWFLKITAFADRLLEAIETLGGWPEKIRTMQRNWIGRSEGVTSMGAAVDSAIPAEAAAGSNRPSLGQEGCAPARKSVRTRVVARSVS